MNRRRFLAALGATSALAGCLGNNQSADGADSTDTPGTAGGSNATRTSSFDLPVPKDELRRGAPKDAIPAITAPVFSDDWSGFDEVNVTLEDSFEVVGVELDGIARAYPLAILN